MDLKRRPAGGDRLADLEHVRPEDQAARRIEVVGVILHEGRASRKARADDLHRAQQGAGLPVALRPEAVAVGHEPLDREPRQLAQPVQVLERGREALEAALFEEGAKAELDPRGVAKRTVAGAAAAQDRGPRTALAVLRAP